MSKPTVSTAMTCCAPAVIWQPYVEGYGQEAALLVQRDANGLLVIEQEGRSVLVMRETLPALIKQLSRLAIEEEKP